MAMKMLHLIYKAIRPSHKKSKLQSEFAYWKARRQRKGGFTYTDFKYFYTTHFGLGYDFYNGKNILDIGCGPRGSLEWADCTSERVGLDPLANS